MNKLPDIQGTEPIIFMPIQQVGVENVEVPFKLQSRDSKNHHETIANVSIRTSLDKNTKGISMSRLIRTLKKYLDQPLKQSLVRIILEDICKNVKSNDAYIRFDFRLPMIRKSIKSDNEFPIYYNCRFEGQLNINSLLNKDGIWKQESYFKFYQGVIIQYSSYCPCSAELSKHLLENGSKGFPHAQRSYANILIQGNPGHYIWLEDIIELVNDNIKTLPYPIIKRIDEQAIAEIAANNPMFVEDAIRIISNELDHNLGIYDWIIKCIHEESIHTSEAIAVCYKGIKNGFDSRYYLQSS